LLTYCPVDAGICAPAAVEYVPVHAGGAAVEVVVTGLLRDAQLARLSEIEALERQYMEGSYKQFSSGIEDHLAFAQLEEAVPALPRRAQPCADGDLAR
jgi:hypothetical protein